MTTEHNEQAALVGWFRVAYPEYASLLFAVPNGAHLAGASGARARQMATLKAEGLTPGVSDLVLLVARGIYHGAVIEIKKPGGVLSPEQVAFLALAASQCYYDIVAWTFEEAQAMLQDYMEQ